MILSLEESSPEPLRPKFRSHFVWTIVAVTTLYISFGVSGYLSYGEETKDIITLNLPHGGGNGLDFAILVKACLSFSLFFTYPVMLFPVTALVEERCLRCLPVASSAKQGPQTLPTPSSSSSSPGSLSAQRIFVRLILVTLTGLVVLLVPRFSDLMALVGATCCTLLAFIMPALCHLVIANRCAAAAAKKSGAGQAPETIDPTLNYVMVAAGGLGMLLGTVDALATILYSPQAVTNSADLTVAAASSLVVAQQGQ